ncbi:MAG: hypothetical protein ACI9R3_004351 [Verrucomicrobiales bacterium]|jgi:hypothetical protein
MKPSSFHLISSLIASGALLASASFSSAANVRVDFSANGPVGFAPLFVAFHNGTFDTFDAGAASSSALETLAEVGDPGGLISTVDAAFTSGAVVGSPVVPPGTSASSLFTVTSANTFFNYAADGASFE